MESNAAVSMYVTGTRQRRPMPFVDRRRGANGSTPLTQEALDRITQLAARELDAPVACLSLIDAERRLFTSSTGLTAPIALLLAWPFCKQVIASRFSLAVSDAREHAIMSNSPAVRDGLMMAYAGTPLAAGDGRAIGALFVMDPKPRHWSTTQLGLLGELAALIMGQVELGRAPLWV